MAFKVHLINKYNYSFDARKGGPGVLQLWSDQSNVARVYFVPDNASVPAPVLTTDLNSATICFKEGSMPGLIDMLRNENPVYLTINNQSPGFVFIHTGQEPVGEGEV